MRGVGPTTARLIREILDTGGCRYHDTLIGC
jgi:DNA polymerase/3'-5' exonuclease PolX